MKYKIIKDNKFLPVDGFAGITIYPFIFVDTSTRNWKVHRDEFINHEKIHLKQQLELLIIPFYIIYFIEYLIKYIKYKDGKRAYRNLSFEREDYTHDDNLDYLKSRKLFSWVKYLNKS